jgi:hypothetical protein
MAICCAVDKGDCKKISSTVEARYFWCNKLALGNITDISSNCMCINTKFIFPLNSMIELLIPLKRNVLTIHARVCRSKHNDSHNDSMCFEVSNQGKDYLEFVCNLGVA